ncbi:MAG: type I-C CRISPR-associated protein Cas8c/Csd1 [Prevotella sp.]
MILKALYDYYNRSIEYDNNSLPKFGMMNAKISFVIVIKRDGEFVRIKDERTNGEGKTFVLPKGVHNNGITPFLFWDNCMYVIDYSNANKPLKESELSVPEKVKKWKKSLDTARQKHKAFVEQCNKIYKETNHPDFEAVVRFYEKDELVKLKGDDLWKEIEKSPIVNISFQLEGAKTLVACNPLLQNYVEKDSEKKGICLITGKKTDLVRVATPTPLPFATSKNSASLVSFQKDYGFDSYGKTQAYNSPMSIEAEFGFSTALKQLISRDSRNKFTIGNRLFVFWASSKNEASIEAEESLFELLGFSVDDKDDPNANIMKVRKVFESIDSGVMRTDFDDYFYILGLAPNLGRDVVVYWSETTLKDFAGKILQHFHDMEIHDTRKDKKPYTGIKKIVSSVSLDGDISKTAPNLPEAVVKSIFQGLPYPESLFQACIRRIRAEVALEKNGKKINPVNIVRAAIIKAYLNRQNNNNKKIEIMLDKDNNNQGYLCGRLFAVLENLQFAANKQDSIRSSYMNAASTTPSTVFSTILKLSNSHYGKLLAKGKRDLANFFDNQKKEIMAMLEEFPDTLELNDQGRFFLGYYHQKNYKENNNSEE